MRVTVALTSIQSLGSTTPPLNWSIGFTIKSDDSTFATGHCMLEADSISQAEIKAKKKVEEFLSTAVVETRSRWKT